MTDTHTAIQRQRNMRAVKSKNTAPELRVRSVLHRLGFRFRLHRKDLPGTPDIAFPSRRRVIFVSGCLWHMHDCARGKLPATNVAFWREKLEKNRARDLEVQAKLRSLGWRPLTVWECEVKDLNQLTRKLKAFLE
jgi:DNA mismatch endonuclease, patch repair protein